MSKSDIWKKREEILFSFYSKESLQDLIDKLYSFSMIYQMIERDNKECFEKLNVKQQTFHKLMKTKIGFNLHPENQKTSTAFRSQFKFPKEFSLQEIESHYLKTSLTGQKKTVNLRKKSDSPYNKKQTLEFWLKETGCEKKAKEKLDYYKRSNSPFCIEFWLKKGLSKSEGEALISERAVKGAIGALKKSSQPKTEKNIIKILNTNSIEFTTQYKITLSDKQKYYNKRCYIYDFYIPKYNLIIECHGLFWHAHPSLYKTNDILKFPRGHIKASDVWKADDHKKNIAVEKKYNYLVIWENEINNTLNLINECVKKK